MRVPQQEKWRTLAMRWHEQGPPATPSVEDLENFAGFVRENCHTNDIRIGILGSTPKLRRTLRSSWPDAEIVVIDFCREMYVATSAVLEANVVDHEEYLCVDWLELGTADESTIDCLVGDKALDNVEMADWPQFFRAAKAVLRPNGLLILHVGFPDYSLSGKPFEELARAWSDVWRDSPETKEEDIAAGLWEDLLSGSSSEDHSVLSLAAYRAALERASRQRDDIGRLATLVLQNYGGDINAEWTSFSESDVLRAAGACGFTAVGMRYGSDYVAAKNQPIMCWRSSGGDAHGTTPL